MMASCFEVGVVSMIACFADSRVYCRRPAYCTDHFSVWVIIKITGDFPPTRVSRIVVCGPETGHKARTDGTDEDDIRYIGRDDSS